MARYVIFDLDDTLVHSGAVRDAFAEVAAAGGVARDAVEAVLDRMPGRTAAAIFAALGLADPDAAARAFLACLDERNATERPVPYPDADATLRALAARGTTLVLSTGSRPERAREVLDRHGWDVFDTIVGSPHGSRKDASHYAAIARRAGDPGWTLQSATVGDSPADMRIGADHGVPVRIGIDRGRGDLALRRAGATHVVRALADVLAILSPG